MSATVNQVLQVISSIELFQIEFYRIYRICVYERIYENVQNLVSHHSYGASFVRNECHENTSKKSNIPVMKILSRLVS